MKSKIKILTLFTFFLLFGYILTNSNKEEVPENNNYTSFFINSTIETVNDTNFEKIVNKGLNNDFIILFTIKRCDICNDLIMTLEKIQKNYSIKKSKNLLFLKVDCLMSGWTAIRFSLERIPNIIYVTNGLYSVYLNDNFTIGDIEDFIESDDKEFKSYPKIMGYFDLFMKIFHVVSDLIKENYPFWNESLSWLVVFLFIIFLCIVQYYILKYCCVKESEKNKNKECNTHSHYEHKEKDKKIKKE